MAVPFRCSMPAVNAALSELDSACSTAEAEADRVRHTIGEVSPYTVES